MSKRHKDGERCECCDRRWQDVTWRCVDGSFGAARMLCSTCAMQIVDARLEAKYGPDKVSR
jgi:hypothetical protein